MATRARNPRSRKATASSAASAERPDAQPDMPAHVASDRLPPLETQPADLASPGRNVRARRTPAAGPAPRQQAVEPPARASLTPETWIDAATQVLVDQGIDHVRVDVLATQLGVTRGSFYWHFRDREDLLRRVLQAWHNRTTEALTQRLAVAQGDPQAQLRDVISLPHRGRAAVKAARIELAIRAWARRDATARQAVDEADTSRIDYHRQIFEALGFAQKEAKLRAFVLYSCEVAESLLHGQGQSADHRARQEFLQSLMLTPLRTA